MTPMLPSGLFCTKRIETTRLRRRSRGLTLMEVLIVLSVISILAALLFPIFGKARSYAQKTVCISNMRQASMAILMYAQDYDEGLPTILADARSVARGDDPVYWHDHFCQATRLRPGQVTWVSLVTPFAGRDTHDIGMSSQDIPQTPRAVGDPFLEMFRCPADRDTETRPKTSYEFKLWLAENRRLPDVAAPSDMVMLWEQWAYHMDGTESEYDRRAAMNTIFVDGHAHWLRLSETTSARYGSGPNLHDNFPGVGASGQLAGQDIGQ